MGNVEVGYSSLDHTFILLHFSDIICSRNFKDKTFERTC